MNTDEKLKQWEERQKAAEIRGKEKAEEEERRRVADLQSSYLKRTGRTEMKP